MAKKATCPDCFFEWELDADVEAHEIVTCPDCGANLEVTALEPEVKLTSAESEAEDWGE